MNRTRWTLGVVLAAAVSLWGLVEADASPFSTEVLSDDLLNTVNGKAPKDPSQYDNNGHGNNEDGVDSSNTGNSKTDLDTVCADGTYCDDETSTTTTTTETKTNSGKKK
jgi:uncharacterized protein with beta-barrel porin domain